MESAAGTRCYVEELASDLFDQIDDLLEFPNDDELLIEMVGPSVSANDNLAPIITPSVEPMLLPLTEDVFTSETQGNSSNGPALIKTGNISSAEEDHLGPCDELEMTQLEWLANFFDEPPSASSPLENPITISPSNKTPTNIKCTTTTPTPTLSLPMPTDTITKDHDPSLLFRTSSPVSVLEQTSFSNGGSSGGSSTSATSFLSSASSFSSNNFSRGSLSPRSVAPLVPNFVVPVRPRSKRPRPSSFSVSRLISTPFLPPSLEIESMAESDPVLAPIPLPASEHLPAHIKKKKKGPRKNSFLGEEEPEWGHIQDHATAARRCMHCRIEKTPQWRAGPMGPKTLCNACGVRYKSGRLFPEYRPAASPTFVPSIHSNSHKKVVEMRLMTTSNSGRGTNLLGFISKRG